MYVLKQTSALIWPSTVPVNVICGLLARASHFHCRLYPDFIRRVTSKRRPFLPLIETLVYLICVSQMYRTMD
ncbi:hypothetical protein DFH07DRAFT_842279 [Mycena maculata]|uniref:Uncharacterized protein n=1 Tax=Mycena maculata TaxID=230809 RepID=A0AAD7MXT3_9AGAR|nr:hypothetical protein DFH07DRAFT_842279 [Mycena maculata]